MTLLAGFMMALSAEMGLRMGVLGSAMSMITTWVCSPTFSRMQMNLSDSMVKVLKPMLAGLMPKFWSWETKERRSKACWPMLLQMAFSVMLRYTGLGFSSLVGKWKGGFESLCQRKGETNRCLSNTGQIMVLCTVIIWRVNIIKGHRLTEWAVGEEILAVNCLMPFSSRAWAKGEPLPCCTTQTFQSD